MDDLLIDIDSDMLTVAAEETPVEVVVVPFEQLNPDTLRNVISEFVTREWEEIGDGSYTLDTKIQQVSSQLKCGKAKLVFDPVSSTCNIIPVP